MSSEKKIRELVYSGNVLDEHGNWIPLAEKINRERTFLSHLEQGEVLIDGLWTRVADALQPKSATQPQIDEAFPSAAEISPRDCASEETISISSDALESISAAPGSRKNDVDFPPETQMFSLVFPDSAATNPPPPPPTRPEMVIVTDETLVDVSMSKIVAESGKKASDHVSSETEFEETVLYNINALKGQQESAAGNEKLLHTDSGAHHPTVVHDLDDEPPHNNIRLIVSVAVITIIGILIGLFLSTL